MLLALPPFPREHHVVGGQALRHVGDQRNRVIAELRRAVRGHQEVMAWPGLVSGGIQTLRGTRISPGGGEASPQSRSQGSAPGRCRPAPPD